MTINVTVEIFPPREIKPHSLQWYAVPIRWNHRALKTKHKIFILEEFSEGVTRSVPTKNVVKYNHYNWSYDGTTNSNEGHSICKLLHTTPRIFEVPVLCQHMFLDPNFRTSYICTQLLSFFLYECRWLSLTYTNLQACCHLLLRLL